MNMLRVYLGLILISALISAVAGVLPAQAIVLATESDSTSSGQTADAAAAGDEDSDSLESTHFPKSRFGMPAQDPLKMEIEEDRAYQLAQKSVSVSRAPAELKRTTSKKPDAKVSQAHAQTKVPVQPLDDVVFDSKSMVQEIAVIATEDGFFPKTIMVSKEVPVRLYITGASSNTLCFMMDAFQVRRQIRSHKVEEIHLTAKEPGLFRFHCPITNVEGTLIVRDFAHRVK